METASVADILPPEPTLESCDNNQRTLDVRLKSREKLVEGFGLLQSEDWTVVNDKKDVTLTKKKVEGSSINAIKKVMKVECPLERIADNMMDFEQALKSNDRLKDNSVVEKIDDTLMFVRREMKGNLVVSNRDMSLLTTVIDLTDGSKVLLSFSEPCELIPETKCVRAEVTISLTLLVPDSETSTTVTHVAQMNPKGSIPSSFINTMQNKQHEGFVKFKKFLEDQAKEAAS